MDKVFARMSVDTYELENVDSHVLTEHISRKIGYGIAERMLKEDLMIFSKSGIPTEHDLTHEYTGSVIIATPEEKKEFELMKAFIKDNNDQENFENFKDWKEEGEG